MLNGDAAVRVGSNGRDVRNTVDYGNYITMKSVTHAGCLRIPPGAWVIDIGIESGLSHVRTTPVNSYRAPEGAEVFENGPFQ